jgi:predicted  nucleic acid-binding Zn-ribbon protein
MNTFDDVCQALAAAHGRAESLTQLQRDKLTSRTERESEKSAILHQLNLLPEDEMLHTALEDTESTINALSNDLHQIRIQMRELRSQIRELEAALPASASDPP